MKYIIKDFRNEGDKKYIGFMVTDDNGNQLAIDKKIDLSDGKSEMIGQVALLM